VGLCQPAGNGHAVDGADRPHCGSGVSDSAPGTTAVVLAGGLFQPGMAKFSYNVIVGLAATVVVAADAQTSGDFGFLLLISVLAPVLALAIAGGAGMAVFRSVSGGVTRLIAVGSTAFPIPR
jgi:nitrate reductase NapE component